MGRGTITAAGPGRWKIRVRAGTDPTTGKPIRLSRTVSGTKTEANGMLSDLIRDADIRRDIAVPKEVTIAELADRWLALKERTISPRTVHGYRQICDTKILPHLGQLKAAKVRGHQIDALYRTLSEQGVNPPTLTSVHRVLRAMFAQAVRWDLTQTSPVHAATAPKHRSRPITPPTAAEFLAGITRLEQLDRDLAVFASVAASTGARRGEMCGLRWGDIDQINGAITISGAVTFDANGDWYRSTTKTGVTHTVAVGPGIIEQLAAMRRRHQEQCDRLDLDISPYLFETNPTNPANPPRPDSWTKRWTRRRTEIGLQSVRLHDLRHYTATMLLAAGVDPVTVAGRLGHSNPAITMKVYAAFLPEKDREAANILDAALTPARRLQAVPDE